MKFIAAICCREVADFLLMQQNMWNEFRPFPPCGVQQAGFWRRPETHSAEVDTFLMSSELRDTRTNSHHPGGVGLYVQYKLDGWSQTHCQCGSLFFVFLLGIHACRHNVTCKDSGLRYFFSCAYQTPLPVLGRRE